MNRRDFMKGVAVSGLLTIVPPEIMARLFVQPLAFQPVERDEEEPTVRIVAIGIGEFGSRAVRSVARNLRNVSCLEATFNPRDGKPKALDDLFAAVRANNLVFFVAAPVSGEERILLEGLGDASVAAGNFPVALLLDTNPGQGEEVIHLSWKKLRFPSITIGSLSQLFNQEIFAGNIQILQYIARHVIDTVVSLATVHGMICIDFADIKAVLRTGHGRVGGGVASGSERSHVAASMALERIIAQRVFVERLSGVLVSIEGDASITMDEYDNVSSTIHEVISEDANVIVGVYVNGLCGRNLKVTIIAVDDAFGPSESKMYLDRESQLGT